MGITLLGLIIFAFIAAGVVFLITQLAFPLIYGTALFPIFRKDAPLKAEIKLKEKELEDQNELIALESQLHELNRRKAELNRRKAEMENKNVDN